MAIPPIGAGSSVAAGGLAGCDIPGLSPTTAVMQNAALYTVVGISRQIALNPDGTAQQVHPVDQEVVFDLTNELGSIPGDPTRGLDWESIRIAPESRKLQTAQDRVNVCLATPLANGDIEIESVVLEDNPPAGQLGLAVTYLNLRVAQNQTSTPQPSPTVRI